jgi:hypothetical protein
LDGGLLADPGERGGGLTRGGGKKNEEQAQTVHAPQDKRLRRG